GLLRHARPRPAGGGHPGRTAAAGLPARRQRRRQEEGEGGMILALTSPLHLDAFAWQLFVAVGTALAFVHAFRKLSPYFAAAWFGSGLVFGWFWTTRHNAPEAVLLPVFVTYLAAALTKGIVEQGRFAGNHLVHVLGAGVFAGLVALP